MVNINVGGSSQAPPFYGTQPSINGSGQSALPETGQPQTPDTAQFSGSGSGQAPQGNNINQMFSMLKSLLASTLPQQASGGGGNYAPEQSQVSGGGGNYAPEQQQVSSGGGNSAPGSQVSGGTGNSVYAPDSEVSGGTGNSVYAPGSQVSGGTGNNIYAPGSEISGGTGNNIYAPGSQVSGGTGNSDTPPADCDTSKPSDDTGGTQGPKPKDSHGSSDTQSVPTPLGIMKGGDKDGYLAYRPAGAKSNDDSNVKYARPLGEEIKGPKGEACFEFDGGKQGYETKDPQDPTHAKTIIQYTDGNAAGDAQTARNQDMKDSASKKLNASKNKDGDVSKIMNDHHSHFSAAISPDQKGIIGRQDWENFANAKDDPKMDTLVQDPVERGRMRAAAQTVTDRIQKADKMSLSDAMNTFRIGSNKDLISGAKGKNTYEKLDSIATGKETLGSVPQDQREHVREAASKIIYSPMSPDEKKVSGGGGDENHLSDNKYGKAQGGPTIFTFLDNAFKSNDNDGSFDLKNFKNVKLPDDKKCDDKKSKESK
jgi:hypothetical protein